MYPNFPLTYTKKIFCNLCFLQFPWKVFRSTGLKIKWIGWYWKQHLNSNTYSNLFAMNTTPILPPHTPHTFTSFTSSNDSWSQLWKKGLCTLLNYLYCCINDFLMSRLPSKSMSPWVIPYMVRYIFDISWITIFPANWEVLKKTFWDTRS